MSDPTFHRAPRLEQESLMSTPMTNTPSPTDEDRELIDKARRKVPNTINGRGTGCPDRLVNPDGPELADRLESLLADRAKLEEALEEADFQLLDCGPPDRTESIRQVIRIALNRSTDRAT